MKNPAAGSTPPDLDPPQSGVWDNVLDQAQAAERRGFVMMLGGLAFGLTGAGSILYRVVVPGPTPLLAEMCRGDVLAVRSVDTPSDRPKAEDIAEDLKAWLRGAREVSFDRDFAARQVWRAYHMTRSGSQAEAMLQAHHRANDPMELAKTQSVKVDRQSAFPAGGVATSNTWKLEWQEFTTLRDGTLKSRVDWRMDLSFVVNPSTTRDALQKNPHGLYVEAFAWGPLSSPVPRGVAQATPRQEPR